MCPTLARKAARSARDGRRIIAVSRWSSAEAERSLNDFGIETIKCDLLDRDAVSKLPDAPNVVFMAGQKFGTSGAPAMTWGMNTIVPALCAERYHGARIVAFSTGNVYPLSPVSLGGSREQDPVGPVGEYAASCVGRERIFELFSERNQTLVAIVRLNYAIDLRYGVLVDIATKVKNGNPVAVDMGYVNVIWQGDANRIALEALARAAIPPLVINVTGTERLSVRTLADRFAKRFGVEAKFSGVEKTDALLSNTARMRSMFEAPETSVETMIDLVADWVESDGPLLGKPTKFEARDGKF
jgi:nucleoside-diphosphate-sugar epimerase